MNKFVATVIGLAVSILTVMLVEGLSHAVFPPPVEAGADMARIVAMIPVEAKLLVMFAWLLGPLIGSAVAARLTAWRPAPWIVAGFSLVGGLATVAMIPHPLWMSVGAVVLPIVALWLGVRLGSRTRATP